MTEYIREISPIWMAVPGMETPYKHTFKNGDHIEWRLVEKGKRVFVDVTKNECSHEVKMILRPMGNPFAVGESFDGLFITGVYQQYPIATRGRKQQSYPHPSKSD